jgi:tRNA A-37 threonylcarbamoyl transferase component Bud32
VSEAPAHEQLAAVVRRRFGLSETHPVLFDEVGEFSNINYVYRVDVPGRRTFYLKVVPAKPKKLPVALPRDRVLSEAEGMRRFRAYAGKTIVIPEVLFVDAEISAVAMSDVGEARSVLYSVIGAHYELLVEQASNLGTGLGSVHAGTANARSPRPAEEETIIRNVIFNGLLGPGAKNVMPELWPELASEMQKRRECLIHGDLWSKNLLVSKGRSVAIVDFEGICMGDPAFDLGTLIAVALLPALEAPRRIGDALDFTHALLDAWGNATRFTFRRQDVEPRAYRAVSVFLAARGFGPFAYPMADDARERLSGLARSLASDPPLHWKAFAERVIRLAVARSA